ncbi:uncharacterized protein KQ657_001094 [Scheffersomyces spartinae]|uniref:6-phosphogluconolactonase-like protein n=1 Tax=Scheffersomyces spartinae TaxID=45513 RepID=A0A9P7V7U2_9ASCO|nr:uncharacterized protein KQ657_001094 [Scheffersomyces spartinae]KAG7192984.1 hypothetical protein KQ657_001094 [Scheffersomyces spartinae]
MSPAVVSYADSSDVASAVGRFVLDAQKKAFSEGNSFKIAVSGGSLGKVMKAALIDDKKVSGSVEWKKWQVYFSDERIVPLTHSDSNYGLFKQMVLDNLDDDNKPKVYTIDDSLDSDEAIRKAYEEILPKDSKFDLVLLGCGPDGHTCSLFPEHPLLEVRDQQIALITDSPKPPPRRITFTFPVLESSKAIAFVAEGAGKAEVLKDIFTNPNSKLPSKLVNDISGVPVTWFVNDAAINGVNVIASKY